MKEVVKKEVVKETVNIYCDTCKRPMGSYGNSECYICGDDSCWACSEQHPEDYNTDSPRRICKKCISVKPNWESEYSEIEMEYSDKIEELEKEWSKLRKK